MILFGSRNQTSYALAPSTGVHCTRPGYSWPGSFVGTSVQRTLRPYGALHGLVEPSGAIARTCAYSAYGLPVSHGSEALTATAGVVSAFDAKTIEPSSNVSLVASSN